MAYAISALMLQAIWKGIKPKLTACDHCGANPEMRERMHDYTQPKLAIVCPNGCAIAEHDANIPFDGGFDSRKAAAESALLNWNRAHYVYASWRPNAQA